MTFMKYSFYFRIVAAPYIAQNIINGNFPMACGLFVYAGATDFLDGYIARNFKNQSSSLGSFLDPLSDKILVGIKGAEANLYTFRYWLFSESIQICFRTL